MKNRLLSIVLALMLLAPLALGCISAQATDEDGYVTISVLAPPDWASAYVYLWEDGGLEAAPWPGIVMEYTASGWWTAQVPSGFTGAVVNTLAGQQTVDLKIDSNRDAWIKIEDSEFAKFYAVVYNDAACTDPYVPPTPSVPDTKPIMVYARVPAEWNDVRIWAWNEFQNVELGPWPGNGLMTDLGADWYCAELPGWVTGILISAYGGSLMTSDISIDPGKDVWILANYDPQSPILSYDEISFNCTHPTHNIDGLCVYCLAPVGHSYNSQYLCDCGAKATSLVTVSFKKTDKFSDVYIQWSRYPHGPYSPADGIKMNVDKDGIYSYRVPTDMLYVNFFDSDGTHCLADIMDMSGADIVYDAASNTWITYKEARKKPASEKEDEPNDRPPADLSDTIWTMVGIVVLLAAGITALAIPVKTKN